MGVLHGTAPPMNGESYEAAPPAMGVSVGTVLPAMGASNGKLLKHDRGGGIVIRGLV